MSLPVLQLWYLTRSLKLSRLNLTLPVRAATDSFKAYAAAQGDDDVSVNGEEHHRHCE